VLMGIYIDHKVHLWIWFQKI